MSVAAAISDISIAPEVAPGSVGTDALPSASGLTFATAFVKRGFSMQGQATPVAPLDCATGGYHTEPGEPIAPYDTGNSRSHQIRQGPLQVTFYLQGIGDNTTWANHEAMLPLHTVLRSIYDVAPAAAHPADTDAAGVAVDVSEHTPTTIARFVAGDLASCVINGIVEWSSVVSVGGGTVKWSPSWSKALAVADSDVVRLARTYYIPATIGTPNGATFATRYSWQGRRCIAYGCRLGNHTFKFENGFLVLEATIENLGIRDESAGTPANASIARMGSGGRVPMPQLQPAKVILSSANAGGAAPIMLTRNIITTHTDQPWSVQVNVPLNPTGGTYSILRAADLEIAAKPSITATVPCEPSTILRTMQQARERRNLVLPCGPHNAGMGFCGFLGGAYLAETPIVGVDGDRQMDSPVFTNGEWEGDDVAAGTAAARVPWKFALPQ